MTELVECPKCGMKCRDFTPEAEFIGWHGHCVRCDVEKSRFECKVINNDKGLPESIELTEFIGDKPMTSGSEVVYNNINKDRENDDDGS